MNQSDKRKHLSSKYMDLLTKPQKRLLHVTFVLSIIIVALVGGLSYNTAWYDQMKAAESFADSLSTRITLTMEKSLQLSENFNNLYSVYGEDFAGHGFKDVARMACENNDAIGSIYLAPDAVLGYAYPEDINEATIGFEMLKDPDQGPMAQLAIDTRMPTVAGPHALVEGGTGLIIRNPLFKGNDFVSFTVIVLDWDKLLEQALSAIHDEKNYEFAVWKEDTYHIVTDEHGYIFSNTDRKIPNDLVIRVQMPNDEWCISVYPIGGWVKPMQVIPQVCIVMLTMAIVLIFVLNRLNENNRHLYTIEHDDLTGLYTRQAFYQRLELTLHNNPDKSYDVMVADVDNFKMYNTIHGEAQGNALIMYLAEAVAAINPGDEAVYARYGGDQIVCFFESENRMPKEEFMEAIKKIAENAPNQNIKVNYGFYGNVEHGIPVNQICDRALQAAKSLRRNFGASFADYNGDVSRVQVRNQELETSFQDALKNREFKIWFQPKYDAKSEKLTGMEALVRWFLPDGTMIPPGAFIHLFEEDGLIVQLDEYVFRSVCEYIRGFLDAGITVYPCSVNLSRSSLFHDGVIETYKKILTETGVPANLVPLELTESAELHSKQLKELTEELKAAGFHLHMDDFGSGYSSLASLNTLPFDVVKLDKTLIDFIGDAGGDEIIRHIIELSHFKKMVVVAEGVEEKEQLEFLKNMGCDMIQGYYFSAPKPYEKISQYLESLDREK